MRRQSVTLFFLSQEYACWWLTFFASLLMSVNVYESTAGIDFGVPNKFWQVGKFTNMESENNEDQLHHMPQAHFLQLRHFGEKPREKWPWYILLAFWFSPSTLESAFLCLPCAKSSLLSGKLQVLEWTAEQTLWPSSEISCWDPSPPEDPCVKGKVT